MCPWCPRTSHCECGGAVGRGQPEALHIPVWRVEAWSCRPRSACTVPSKAAVRHRVGLKDLVHGTCVCGRGGDHASSESAAVNGLVYCIHSRYLSAVPTPPRAGPLRRAAGPATRPRAPTATAPTGAPASACSSRAPCPCPSSSRSERSSGPRPSQRYAQVDGTKGGPKTTTDEQDQRRVRLLEPATTGFSTNKLQ